MTVPPPPSYKELYPSSNTTRRTSTRLASKSTSFVPQKKPPEIEAVESENDTHFSEPDTPIEIDDNDDYIPFTDNKNANLDPLQNPAQMSSSKNPNVLRNTTFHSYLLNFFNGFSSTPNRKHLGSWWEFVNGSIRFYKTMKMYLIKVWKSLKGDLENCSRESELYIAIYQVKAL